MATSSAFNLSENERIIKVVYHHPEIIAPNLILSLLVLLLDFFMMYFFFLQGLWGVIVFCLVFIVVGFYIFRLFFLYRTNKFILTNKRLVDFEQTGLFKKNITEIAYSKIDGVEVVVRGVLASIFKFGNLKVILRDGNRPLELYKIAKPLEVQQIINDRVNNKVIGEKKSDKPKDTSPISMTEVPHLNKLDRLVQDIDALSLEEKEDLFRVLEDELRGSRSDKA